HVGELLASLVACAIRNARYTTELQAELHERRVLEQRLQDVIRTQDARVEELRTVMETVPAGVLIASDPDCTRIVGNAEAYRQWRADANSGHLSPSTVDGSGTPHYVIRRAGQIVAPDDLPMQRAAKLGIATRDEEQELVFDDGSRSWLAVSATPLLDAEGTPRGAVGAALDITRTKQIEADLLERQEELEDEVHERTRAMIETHQRLREMERMATIGTLSAGLGHDMGNLLLPLRLRLDSLNSMTLPDPAPSDLAAIATVLEYLQRLATGLRSLAVDPNKPDHSSHSETRLRAWWADVHNLMRNAVPPGVTLSAKIPARLPLLRISSAALTQAVLNIVQNGGHALRNRAEAHIEVRAESVPGKNEVRLMISDNGPGMDEQARKHCFEPFFSTKKRQISTGLGLAVVRAVITGAGGAVAVESKEGEGATFVLTIPVNRRSPAESMQAVESRRALVTVVDPRQRALIASVLKHDGCAVKHGEHDVEGSCDLWVTDAASPRSSTDLLSFVGAGKGRVALIMNVAATPVAHPRIRAVPSASDVSVLRAMLSSVVGGTNGDETKVV
ncbi:MAG: ATP-binding protein, partial [Gemmatimonadaceae bacterium]